MKLNLFIILQISLILGTLSLNLKSEASARLQNREDFTEQWKTLFGAQKQVALCIAKDTVNNVFNPIVEKPKTASAEIKLPKAHPNPYWRGEGTGSSAFLFDYIEPVFNRTVLKQFQEMFDAAKAFDSPTINIYDDPFSIEKMLFFLSQGVYGSIPGSADFAKANANNANANAYTNKNNNVQNVKLLALPQHPPTEAELTLLKKYITELNFETYKESVTTAQLHHLVKQWGWTKPTTQDWAADLLKLYDFDGDGRLNAKEFLTLAIVNNSPSFRSPLCKKYCFADILENIIDPIYGYLDCDGDGRINALNIWKGLESLERPQKDKYNIYKCVSPNDPTKALRIESANDLVLKSGRKEIGILDRNEFRVGILLGFLARSESGNIIDDFSSKAIRWVGETEDADCTVFTSYFSKGDTEIAGNQI